MGVCDFGDYPRPAGKMNYTTLSGCCNRVADTCTDQIGTDITSGLLSLHTEPMLIAEDTTL
jgi:hypothetical protein